MNYDRFLDVVTYATRFPPYVFSTNSNAAVVHRVDYLELQWYWWDYDYDDDDVCVATSLPSIDARELADVGIVRLNRPRAIAVCFCGSDFYVDHHVQMCERPHPEALMCGRCHGEPGPFGQHGYARKLGITKQAARQVLRSMAEANGRAHTTRHTRHRGSEGQ